MKLRRNLYALALFVCSISVTYFVTVSTARQQAKSSNNDYQIGGTLYMQKSAEYRAIAYQAFNQARWQLDADLEKKNLKQLPKAERKKPRAIMVDIDETMLDNSPAQSVGILNKRAFNIDDWYAWGKLKKAKPIPGAVDFVNDAVSKGVKVFFVSNRDEVQKTETVENLITAKFKDVSSENVLLRQLDSNGRGISTKEPRREFILQKYRIVMFIGDNLDDHSDVFEKKAIDARFAEVDKARDLFGKRYIVLPNAMYGTWENAIYDYNNALSPEDREKKRAAALELP